MTQVLNIIRLGDRTVRADKIKFWRLVRVDPVTDQLTWVDPSCFAMMIYPLTGVAMLGETDDGQPISVIGPSQELVARMLAITPAEAA